VGPRFRFIVEGTGYTATNFTVSAGGEEVVIPVQVVPQTGLAATFSNPTPVLGEAVTLTAPAGITFNLDATLDIGGTALTIVSQDASSITFIPPPSVNSPVTVNGVVSSAAPDVVFSPATDTPLQTPLIDTVDVTYSNVAPALGETVTMTVTEPLINLVVDSIVFPGQLPGREGDAQNILVAADSNSLTFDTPPNVDGSATVVNFAFPGDYLIALPTRPNLTAPNIGLTLPATISDINPDVSETVTITAPAGFSFDPATTVTVGANAAIVVANDGASVGIVPLPGSIGIPQIDGVVPDAAPSNILTMAAEQTVTVPPTVPTLPGTDAPGTAPALSIPGVGASTVTFEAPDLESSPNLYYLLTVPAGTFDFTLDWNVGGDIDFVLCNTTCADPFGADLIGTPTTDPGTGGFQAATGSHPEHSVLTLAAGSYILHVNDFQGDAQGTTLTLTITRTN
jgi:hypothetical protein